MSAATELQQAARNIRASVPPATSRDLATADLLDQVALSAPYVECACGADMHLPPITRLALAVARARATAGGA